MEIILQLLLLALGFVMLGKGADWFVEGAAGIAARFGIPQMVIGLTIVAMGTSAPEAAVSIASAFQGNADITIGNIVGSNIMNVLVILGLTAAIRELNVLKPTIRIDIPFMIAVTVLLWVLGVDGTVSFTDGLILWACFLIYNYRCYHIAKNSDNVDADEYYGFSGWQTMAWTLGGMALIAVGSEVTVNAAVKIAQVIGISERIIGLTIVALGTSLPELFTSVTAALKGNPDLAIGNIVGSNIFNILFVVGTSALLVPIPFAQEFMFDMYSAIATAVLLLLCVLRGKLARWAGILMLAVYAAYLWHIL